ncbi:MAG: hypothetical protein ABI402_01890 [Ferruginibacter sp.]
MKIIKKILTLSLFSSLLINAHGQSTLPHPNAIDTICTHIDSIITTKSFERFYFDLNQPNISLGYRLHYIDTATKLYKKIIFKNDIDTSIKTFYFRKDTLIEIRIEKNNDSNQTAKYQFNDVEILSKWDPYGIVKDVTRLAPEGKRYYMLVRYSKNTF